MSPRIPVAVLREAQCKANRQGHAQRVLRLKYSGTWSVRRWDYLHGPHLVSHGLVEPERRG